MCRPRRHHAFLVSSRLVSSHTATTSTTPRAYITTRHASTSTSTSLSISSRFDPSIHRHGGGARGGRRVPRRAVRVQRRRRGAQGRARVRDAGAGRRERGVEGRGVRRGARARRPPVPAAGARRRAAAGVLLLPRRRVLHRVAHLAQLPELLPPVGGRAGRRRRRARLPPRSRAPPPRGVRGRRERAPLARLAGAPRRRHVGRRGGRLRAGVRLRRLGRRGHRPPRRPPPRVGPDRRRPGARRGVRAAVPVLRRRGEDEVGGGVPAGAVPDAALLRPGVAPRAAAGRHEGPPAGQPVRAGEPGDGRRRAAAAARGGRPARPAARPRRGLRREAEGDGEAGGDGGVRGAAPRVLRRRAVRRRRERAGPGREALRLRQRR